MFANPRIVGRRRSPARVLVVLGLATIGLALATPPAGAAGGSYSVTSVGDQADVTPGDGVCLTATGTCTLRAALTEANLDAGASSVSFAIAGSGVHTIQLAAALPRLTDVTGGTTIDGYTQAGASVNTDPLADNAVLRIEIRGAGSTAFDALDVASPDNVVRGLAFYDLRLAVDMVFGGDGNVIVGNFIGTDASGTFADTVLNADSFGVVIDQLASNNIVGRPNAADRNVISGNPGRGVMLKDAVLDNTVQNNIIGLTPDGTARLPNADHGVDVNSGATRTIIGGTGTMEGNVISGNDGHGVEVSHPGLQPTADNEIIGNRIGTDVTGDSGPAFARNGDRFDHENLHTEDQVTGTVIAHNVVGNSALGGIKVDSDSRNTSIHDNRIGISADGAPISNGAYGVQIELGSTGTVVSHNIIANNRTGIRLQGDDTVRNTITENSIYGNTRLGIDIAPLDVVNAAAVATPTNGGIHFPALSGATSTSVAGDACAGCRVEVFVADSTETDASVEASYGEGRTFLAAATATSGGAFTVTIPSRGGDRVVTATATDPAGNTSEFSRNLIVPGTSEPAPYRPFASWDAFVARQLADFNGSAGTVSSRAAAVTQLSDGDVTPADFIASLVQRPYFSQNVAPVTRLYTVLFERLPDHAGLTYWSGRHRAGSALVEISRRLYSSREFQADHGGLSNTAFIAFVYESAFDRDPDAAGLRYWVGRLEAGRPRGTVVAGFSESNEYRARSAARVQVVMVFAGMLHRSPSAGEMLTWVPMSTPALIESIRLGREYATLVG